MDPEVELINYLNAKNEPEIISLYKNLGDSMKTESEKEKSLMELTTFHVNTLLKLYDGIINENEIQDSLNSTFQQFDVKHKELVDVINKYKDKLNNKNEEIIITTNELKNVINFYENDFVNKKKEFLSYFEVEYTMDIKIGDLPIFKKKINDYDEMVAKNTELEKKMEELDKTHTENKTLNEKYKDSITSLENNNRLLYEQTVIFSLDYDTTYASETRHKNDMKQIKERIQISKKNIEVAEDNIISYKEELKRVDDNLSKLKVSDLKDHLKSRVEAYNTAANQLNVHYEEFTKLEKATTPEEIKNIIENLTQTQYTTEIIKIGELKVQFLVPLEMVRKKFEDLQKTNETNSDLHLEKVKKAIELEESNKLLKESLIYNTGVISENIITYTKLVKENADLTESIKKQVLETGYEKANLRVLVYKSESFEMKHNAVIKKNKELEAKLLERVNNNTAMEMEIVSMGNNINEKEKDYEKLLETNNNLIANINSNLSVNTKLNEEVDNLRNEKTKISDKGDILNEIIKANAIKILGLIAKNKENTDEKNKMEKQIKTLQDIQSLYKKQIDDLITDKDTKTKDIQGLSAETYKIQGEIVSLKKQIIEFKGVIELLGNEKLEQIKIKEKTMEQVKDLANEITRLAKTNEQLNLVIGELNNKSKDDKIAYLNDITQAEKANGIVTGDLKKTMDSIEKISRDEIKDLRQKIIKNETIIQRQNEEKTDMNKKFLLVTDQFNSREEEIETAKEKLSKLGVSIEILRFNATM
jgi:hypothetical protein